MIKTKQTGYSTISVGNKLLKDWTKRSLMWIWVFKTYISETSLSPILLHSNNGFFRWFLRRPSFRVETLKTILMTLSLKDSTLPVILLFGFFFCLWFLDFHIFLRLLFGFFHRCFCRWWFGLLCWFRWFWCFSFFIFWHLKTFELEFQVLKVNSSKIKDCFVTLEYWMVEIQSSIAMEIKRRIHKLSYFQCTFLNSHGTSWQ